MRSLVAVLLTMVSFPAMGDVESESNNTENLANTLTAGSVITGQLANDTDFDYYQIASNNSDALKIEFTSTNSTGTENLWVLIVQRPSDNIIVFQQTLNPTSESPINRTVEISENGNYIILIAPVGGSTPTPSEDYDLTAVSYTHLTLPTKA